ncbi:MAPEG family protein [Zhongshania aquimaris]|uniref:MAPEG family protein n=1 Tax=Zhongshania aquimaris TaxID=2857107 RepID=A0ABS6VN90_9GAMM|nr:MAPEG family protein [Zhongshania aquimaris]MBW2939783.1 MAPEG family protein [Zhongshania aquimaris]
MLEHSPIFTPVVVLILWTFVMLFWMALVRLPMIAKLKLKPEAGERTSELALQLPPKTQWKADNYNHLVEQPTLFYATAFLLAFIGGGDGLNLSLAWLYVGGRIVHSLVHATINKVMLRFTIFLLTSIALLIMAINAAMILLN